MEAQASKVVHYNLSTTSVSEMHNIIKILLSLKQVCLMSQSWDNVNTIATSYSTIEPVSIRACADEDHTPHWRPRVADQTHRVIAKFSVRSNVESTTRPWQRTDIASCFAWACRNARLARARECISLAPRPWQPRLCTRHNNSDQSWVFWTCRRAHLLCPPG